MATLAAQARLTPEEYITFERKTLPDAKIIRHEYINGELIAMSGASRAHNLVTINISTALHSRLRGTRCETYANEMRVSTPTTTSYFYPDVVVVCEEPRFEDGVFDTLLNPIILVEMLSPSTEVYDHAKNSRTTDNSCRYRNTSSFLQTKCLSNTTNTKRNRTLHPLLGQTGFSPISKILGKSTAHFHPM